MSLQSFERRVPVHSDALHDRDDTTVEGYEREACAPVTSVKVISGEESWHDQKSAKSKPC